MDLSKVAVFGTTHILSDRPLFSGQRPEHVEVFRGKLLETYSTGRLEEALSLGYEVFVCSIRPAFGKHDAWWLRLLDKDRVFNAKRIMTARDGASAMSAAHEPWRELYARLGVPWPEGQFNDMDAPAEWLFSRCGAVRGSSFRGHRLPS